MATLSHLVPVFVLLLTTLGLQISIADPLTFSARATGAAKNPRLKYVSECFKRAIVLQRRLQSADHVAERTTASLTASAAQAAANFSDRTLTSENLELLVEITLREAGRKLGSDFDDCVHSYETAISTGMPAIEQIRTK